jgi:hypothetical protein
MCQAYSFFLGPPTPELTSIWPLPSQERCRCYFANGPLTEGCGLCFEGAGRVWKGPSAVGETLDEGDQTGVSRRISI